MVAVAWSGSITIGKNRSSTYTKGWKFTRDTKLVFGEKYSIHIRLLFLKFAALTTINLFIMFKLSPSETLETFLHCAPRSKRSHPSSGRLFLVRQPTNPGYLKSMRIVDCFPLKKDTTKSNNWWRKQVSNNLPIHEMKLLSPRLCCWVFLLTSSWPEVGHNSSETWPSRLWAFEVKSWIPFELRGRNHEDWRWQSGRFLLCWRWEVFFWYGKGRYPNSPDVFPQ